MGITNLFPQITMEIVANIQGLTIRIWSNCNCFKEKRGWKQSIVFFFNNSLGGPSDVWLFLLSKIRHQLFRQSHLLYRVPRVYGRRFRPRDLVRQALASR